ncbi:PDZ domain-containing protein [Arsukibacterium tuosuense]|uniref:PDZ domain-containing protein n=1 Tax=Arsukibacterium tuosuense TaxID=1323745 RepID=A0A285IMW5_9GAMM|nr:PDZ domain-containing protein [Arsukibacterium tuosuense]SNY49318.1 PDZ domain-containing protein [Arsukibacterium tuosuense]
MKVTKLARLCAAMTALWITGADARQPEPSQDVIEAVQAAIMASGNSAEDGPVTIEEPARNYYHFGAVMDRQHKILAVTPDSDAERAGVKVGDKVLQINNATLDSTSLEDVLALLNDFEEGKPFNVWVNRAGKAINLKSTVTRKTIPAWRLVINPVQNADNAKSVQTDGCGFVSVFYFPPRTLELFPTAIRAAGDTDFRIERSRRTDVVKIDTGLQDIELAEQIALSRVRWSRSDLWERRKQLTQVLQLNVEPNKVYHLASRFIEKPEDRTDPDQYWEPVVWKVTDRQCD